MCTELTYAPLSLFLSPSVSITHFTQQILPTTSNVRWCKSFLVSVAWALSCTEDHKRTIKDVVRSSVMVPEFDKHLKKAGGHIGRNVVEITIKIKTIVQNLLMIIIIKGRYLWIRPCEFSNNLDVFFCKDVI